MNRKEEEKRKRRRGEKRERRRKEKVECSYPTGMWSVEEVRGRKRTTSHDRYIPETSIQRERQIERQIGR